MEISLKKGTSKLLWVVIINMLVVGYLMLMSFCLSSKNPLLALEIRSLLMK